MTRNFFRQLKADKVRYLLISGQATVLYGAATFSEDLDIWLCPQDANRQRFIKALRTLRARYYKLTPPLTTTYLRKGHGFHFTLPAEDGTDWYLDVMGVPPRSPAFNVAWRRSIRMKTPWGMVPVVSVPDLVELKKTQRLEDYAVISRLVVALMNRSGLKPSHRLARWAVQNIFSPALLTELIQQQPWIATCQGHGMAGIRAFGSKIVKGEKPGQILERRIEREMMKRMTACQAADRLYWRRIIAELKSLRAQGCLMPEGRACPP
ncbi:MAG: hypothetical protein L6437_16085 [Kiritimatiellae bacterium]|nr:hypothetical protein [Kiritimatiellia bacterium]